MAASGRLLRQIFGDADAAAAGTADAHQPVAFVGRLHFVLVLGHHFPFGKVLVVLLVVQDLAAGVGLVDHVLRGAAVVVVNHTSIIVVVHRHAIVIVNVNRCVVVVVCHDGVIVVVVCGIVVIVVVAAAEHVQVGGDLRRPDDVLAEVGLPSDHRWLLLHHWNVNGVVVADGVAVVVAIVCS